MSKSPRNVYRTTPETWKLLVIGSKLIFEGVHNREVPLVIKKSYIDLKEIGGREGGWVFLAGMST